jgi:hypothetical protein
MTALLKKRRGFVLIVALMLAIATAAVAVGLVQAGGQANVGVTHTNAGEAARAIAEAGIARAEAYALTVSRGRTDFDRVLDPGVTFGGAFEADCQQLDQVTDTGVVPDTLAGTVNLYLPVFTDAGTSTLMFEGLRYRMVPYNGGAYLVRFSDDFDDGPAAPGGGTIDWAASTSNSRSGGVGTSTWCAEGPAATGAAEPGINGVNNPARDRNRTIYANVIGIYPGTNPATAKHRTMLSKVLMDGRVIGPAGMRIGGDLDVENGAEVELCSQVSGVTATGNISSGNPGSCACGTVQAVTVDLDDGSCGGCCGANTYDPVAGAAPPAPIIPLPRKVDWYDWTSSCNFFMDTATMSFYFWDAAGSRNGFACGTHAGDLPAPVRDVTDAARGACWAPIWFNNHATPAANYQFVYPLEIAEADAAAEIDAVPGCAAAGGAACTLEWLPRNVSIAAKNIGNDAAVAADQYYNAAGVMVAKPDWSQCPNGATSDFSWNPPQPGSAGEPVSCSTCDGSKGTWRAIEGSGAGMMWRMLDNPDAYPVGVYFHSGNLHLEGSGGPSPKEWFVLVPAAQMPLSANDWPMITLIVDGHITAKAGGEQLVLGVGSRKKLFPSLVVGGNFDTDNGMQLALAGSLYVRGNLSFDHGAGGGSYLYGRVEVLGDFHQENGSRVDWEYNTDLYAAGILRRAQEPRLGLPLGF